MSPGSRDDVLWNEGESRHHLESFPNVGTRHLVLWYKVSPLEVPPESLGVVEVAATRGYCRPGSDDSIVESLLVITQDTLRVVRSERVQFFEEVGVEGLRGESVAVQDHVLLALSPTRNEDELSS